MANHKRRRPKHQRGGCLMCKPWKDERSKDPQFTPSERRRLQDLPELSEEELLFNECDGDCDYCKSQDEGSGPAEAA